MPQTARGLNYVVTDLRPPWRRSGLPVVFHHGIGTNLDLWSDWVPVIAAHHPVVRFDTRGFGSSPVPPVDHAWSFDELLSDLTDVIDTVAPSGKVHIAGGSLGGTVALLAGVALAGRIASVAISNAAYKGQGIAYVANWRSEMEREGMAAWSARLMERRFLPGSAPAEALDWFGTVQAATPAHANVGLGELLAGADLTEQMKRLDKPLLILSPDSSPFVPVRFATELAELVPHAEVAIFPGARHGLPLTHGTEAAGVLQRFLRRVEAGEMLPARGPRPA